MFFTPTEVPANCDDIHPRLLAGEPTASADLFACHAASLARQLASTFRTTDPDLIHDAVVSALLDVGEHAERFDPSRRSLTGYLFMVARRDLLNLLDKHRPRLEHETPVDPVELERVGRNITVLAHDVLGADLADREATETLVRQAMGVAQTEEERVVMRLMLDGEKATEVFATAIGLTALPVGEQRSRVYAVKDRLVKRLRRQRRASGA